MTIHPPNKRISRRKYESYHLRVEWWDVIYKYWWDAGIYPLSKCDDTQTLLGLELVPVDTQFGYPGHQSDDQHQIKPCPRSILCVTGRMTIPFIPSIQLVGFQALYKKSKWDVCTYLLISGRENVRFVLCELFSGLILDIYIYIVPLLKSQAGS